MKQSKILEISEVAEFDITDPAHKEDFKQLVKHLLHTDICNDKELSKCLCSIETDNLNCYWDILDKYIEKGASQFDITNDESSELVYVILIREGYPNRFYKVWTEIAVRNEYVEININE